MTVVRYSGGTVVAQFDSGKKLETFTYVGHLAKKKKMLISELTFQQKPSYYFSKAIHCGHKHKITFVFVGFHGKSS